MPNNMKNICNKLTLSQLGIIYVLVVGLITHIFEIPEIVKAFLALPGFLTVPYVLGDIVNSIILKRYWKDWKETIENLEIVSLTILNWVSGSIIIIAFASFFDLLTVFNFNIFYYSILSIIFIYFILNIYYFSPGKNHIIVDKYLLLVVLIIGISSILMYKSYSIFPLQYENPAFVIHSHQILRIMENNLLNFTIESYLPLFYLFFAVVSRLFNVHPYSLFWTFPFLGSSIWALGLFFFGKKVTNNRETSLLAAFFGSYLFSGGYFISNFAITQRGLEIILLPFLIYLGLDLMFKDSKSVEKGVFMKIIFLSVFIYGFFLIATYAGFQRALSGDLFFYKNTLMRLSVVLLLCAGYIILRFIKDIPKSHILFFFLSCFILWAIHMADSTLSILILLFFFIYTIFSLNYPRFASFFSVVITVVLILWIVLQKANIMNLNPDFMITNILLKGAYEGSLYQVGFEYKYSLLERVFPETFLIITIFASFILSIINFKYIHKNMKMPLSASTLAIFGIFFFLLPDPIFYRISGYVAPFAILIISYAIISFLHVFPKTTNIHSKSIILVFLFLALITLVPIAFNSFYNYSMYGIATGKTNNLINEASYEYQTAIWIKKNLPRETFIVSDIWTRRYLIGIANTKVEDEDNPWDRLRYDETSLTFIPSYGAFVGQLKLSLEKSNSKEIYYSIKNLTKSEKIIIIVSGRTESWTDRKDLSFENEIHNAVSEKFLSKFQDENYFTPLYFADDKIYIFGVNPEPEKPFKIEKADSK